MAPTLAPPAGGFKWRDDEYWNKHEGLMTQTWPKQMESRERVKNKPMTINCRTMSAANLPEMTRRPRDRPSTVPANLPSNMVGRRFLDNIDAFMGKSPAPVEADSAPSTPGRGRNGSNSGGQQRSRSEAEIGQGRGGRGADPRSPFKANMYFFEAGMAKAEPLNMREQDRIAYGLPPKAAQAGGNRGRGGPPARGGQMVRNMKMGPADMGGMGKGGMQINGVSVPYTNNQQYGQRSGEAERPSQAHLVKGKTRTDSNVVMGM